MKRVCFALALFGLLAMPALSVASAASANVPLDSPIYAELDKLAGLGLIASGLQGTLPLTRIEAGRLLAEAQAAAQIQEVPPVAHELLERLEARLHEELLAQQDSARQQPDNYLKPLRSLSVAYVYRDGESSFYPGTNARQFSLLYNNAGLNYPAENSLQLGLESEAQIAGTLHLSLRPLVLLTDEGDADLRLYEGKAAVGLGPLEISAGRQSLWWGAGRHGTLVLTNNAKPLDMVRITNPSPVLLPWVLDALGPFRFDVFWSRLDKDRVVAEPYFAALRMAFKPWPYVEIGGSRTVMFGGAGRPKVGLSDFITILGGKNLAGAEDTSNSIAALDLRVKLPFLWNTEIYGEWGGEDEANHFLANEAYLVGLYLPVLEPSRRSSFRMEYGDFSTIDDNSPPWYKHGIYRSGYTYEERILGHHVGGAAKDLFFELSILFPHNLSLALELDIEKRGYDQPLIEKHLHPAIELVLQASDRLRISGRYAVDLVSNHQFQAGQDATLHQAFLSLDFSL